MKQILQDLKSGETRVTEVPSPKVKAGHLRIRTNISLISAGTERMVVGFGKSNYIQKARQQPEKVSQVINKIATDGISATLDTVKARLDEPQPLGYSNVGVVTHVGEGVGGFAVGDRVVSNGRHAEIVIVPKNLCAKVPETVSDEQASFTVVSSIALQGVRLAMPTLGETVVVFGLGLIGLITVQILNANGCRVLGIDVSQERVDLAKSFGVEAFNLSSGTDPVNSALTFSKGYGADAVIITASATDDSIVHQAAKMSRQRGRIILVGVVGLKLNRSDFYEKELSFQVSCSYGPGRYDPFYEDKGNDYPLGFVRWTEQRNFFAVLELMTKGALITEPLISAREALSNAPRAYDKVVSGEVVTVVLKYSDRVDQDSQTITRIENLELFPAEKKRKVRVGVVGAGNFTKARLLPSLEKSGVIFDTIASAQGVTSASAAEKYKFINNTNDVETIWANDEIDTVFVTTRHDSHAKMVIDALNSGKNIFVEKPLCLTLSELEEIQKVYRERNSLKPHRLMVGFNRRFAPTVVQLKSLLQGRAQPITAIYTVNSGYIPQDHWAQDFEVGGGRILGEACHFIDLLQFLVGQPIISVYATQMGDVAGVAIPSDKMTITLEFKDGSHGSIHYFSNGAKGFSKERIEVFSDGRIAQIDNYKKIKMYGFNAKQSRPGGKALFGGGQDKGHDIGFCAFLDAIKAGEASPISFHEIVNSTLASFAAMESVKTRKRVIL